MSIPLLKHSLRFLLFLLLLIFISQLLFQNYTYYLHHSYHSLFHSFLSHLQITFNTIPLTLDYLISGQWTQLVLVKYLVYLFNYKVYWLVLGVVGVICYYQAKNRLVEEKNVKDYCGIVSVQQYQKEKKDNTQKELDKLVSSPAYKEYAISKNGQTDTQGPIDQDFIKDWEQNENYIFSQ